jgi:hypothetical protein
VDGFEPLLRDGFNAAGSHAHWVIETFKRIKHEYPTLTLHPFDGFPGNRVPIIEAVAPLVMTIIQSAVDIARGEEAARGLRQGIGGTFQAADDAIVFLIASCEVANTGSYVLPRNLTDDPSANHAVNPIGSYYNS